MRKILSTGGKESMNAGREYNMSRDIGVVDVYSGNSEFDQYGYGIRCLTGRIIIVSS